MNTNMVSSQGTAFSDAIQLAVDYFDVKDTSKLIVLISDGEDHGDGVDDAIEMAKEKEFAIISIGVGTEKEVQFRFVMTKELSLRIKKIKKDKQ